MKKLLALVLALVMVMSLSVVSTNAAFKDDESIDHDEAVEVMNTLNIINGYEDGSFKPDLNVTRAQMAKMVAIALLGEIDPNAFTGTPVNLTDIDGHWAEGYIKFCVGQGIVAGRGNGQFDPEANVTTAEAAKMLLVALGFNAEVRKYVGGQWSLNVMRDAQQRGLLAELTKAGTNNAMDRDDAAQMIYNTLNATRVIPVETYNDDGTTSTKYLNAGVGDAASEPKTLLNKTFKAYEFKGVLTNVSYDDVKKEYTYKVDTSNTYFGFNGVTATQEDPDDITGPFTAGGAYDFTSTKDYSDLYAMGVKVLYSVNTKDGFDKVLGINADKSKVIATDIVGHLPEAVSNDRTQDEIKIDSKAYKLTGTQATTGMYQFTYGTTAPRQFDTIEGCRPGAGDLSGGRNPVPATDGYRAMSAMKLIDNTGDGKGDCLIIYPVGVAKVTYASSSNFTLASAFTVGNSAAAADFKSYKIADVDVYSGIAKDDYVVVTPAANTANNTAKIVKLDTAKATVKAINNADNTANIDSDWFHTDFVTQPSAGDEINYVVYNGFFVFLEGASFTGADKFVVAVDVAGSTKSSSVGGQKLEVKFLQSDGSKKTVDVTKVNNVNVAAASAVTRGNMYAYKIDSDGYYELFDVTTTYLSVKGNSAPTPGLATSFTDLIIDNTAVGDAKNLSLSTTGIAARAAAPSAWVTGNDNSRFTGLPAIADDAVIYVYTSANGGAYSVITGAQLKQTSNTMTMNMIGTVTNSATNFEEIKLAYLSTTGAITTKENYAFALADSVTYADGKKYYVSIKFWDGEQVQELRTPSEASAPAWAAGIKARDIFTYELDSSGYMNSSSAEITANAVAVQAYAGANITINTEVFYTSNGNVDKRAADTTGTTYTIDKDTTIFYVHSADKEGRESGSIQLAQKTRIDAVSTSTAYFVSNAKVKTTGNHIDFIVIDVNNDMDNVQ